MSNVVNKVKDAAAVSALAVMAAMAMAANRKKAYAYA